MSQKVILERDAMNRSLRRLSHEIIERNQGLEDVVILGILTRGRSLAYRLKAYLDQFEGADTPIGTLDITMSRDDRGSAVYDDDQSEIPFSVTGKKVVIVDDVLYTGRTVRAAIESIFKEGRPSMIQLAVLIDRGHRELPIRADYVGKNVPTSHREKVLVQLLEDDGLDQVSIIHKDEH